jgi:carbamoyltransferase
MIILGINAYHGDASAAILVDGKLIAAAEEERFNRVKHSAGFPYQAVKYCVDAAGIGLGEIDHIAIPRDPRARLAQKVLYAFRMPRFAIDRFGALVKFAGIADEVSKALDSSSPAQRRGVPLGPGEGLKAHVHRVEHHKSHLASSFFVSPFDEAAVLSVDGLGDFATTMWGVGRGARIDIDGAITFPHSLGLYYQALTQYLGFWKYGDEYKVMGLAAYGEPAYQEEFARIVRLGDRLGFSLGLDYFIHHKVGANFTWREGAPVSDQLYSNVLERRLGEARTEDAPIEPRHQAIAASLQVRLEDAMFSILNKLHRRTRLKRLCLAGGVAYNCVVNGRIFDETPFEDVYIAPAAGDAGLAIGAAFYVYHQLLGHPRSFTMGHAYWGPEFGDPELREALDRRREVCERQACVVRRIEDQGSLCRWTAKQIAEGKIVGWFQGRMEWGPRALGNRSIVVDPRRPEMKDVLNNRIKHREPFRPFAPSILEERVGEYFVQSYPSPFMLMTYKVRPEKRDVIPAPTHVDGTGRLQTVSVEQNPLYWRLIHEFERLTGVPVLLNTSFNENEPIVRTPEEALDCFLRTKMDVLVLKNYVMEKAPVLTVST